MSWDAALGAEVRRKDKPWWKGEYWLDGVKWIDYSADPVAMGDFDVNLYGPYYMSRVATIGGGSNEIQRKIMARSVLDLPSK